MEPETGITFQGPRCSPNKDVIVSALQCLEPQFGADGNKFNFCGITKHGGGIDRASEPVQARAILANPGRVLDMHGRYAAENFAPFPYFIQCFTGKSFFSVTREDNHGQC